MQTVSSQAAYMQQAQRIQAKSNLTCAVSMLHMLIKHILLQ
jgi:hypothetical protein